jgi:hypothetical protein
VPLGSTLPEGAAAAEDTADADADLVPEAEAETDADFVAETEADADLVPEAEAETDADLVPEAEAETDADLVPETEAEADLVEAEALLVADEEAEELTTAAPVYQLAGSSPKHWPTGTD